MANFLEDKNRRVIPNWRSFNKTSHLGELNSFNVSFKIKREDLSILEYIESWKRNNELIYASDLLSAASVNNMTDNIEVKIAAKFILENQANASKSQIKLATKILEHKKEINFTSDFSNINSDTLLELTNPNAIKERVNFIRGLIKKNPLNSIYYVELSRYYSILNFKEKAISAMKIALHLSSDNRFVLRSAVRLFTHFDEIEIAHDLLRKKNITNNDPWLTSAEISLATARNRTSKFINKGIELINSKNISPFSFSELASSIGTVELLSGSHKKSRDFFSKALISPNDNSLAQVEWASSKDSLIEVDPSKFPVQLNFEALTLDSFHNSKYDEALNNAAKWFLDMPFSKRPITFASNLASTVMKEHKKAISFLDAGLKNHPHDPLLLNNIAYSLSLDNRPKEALEHLDKILKNEILTESNEICITATKGLAYFRMGLPEKGREFYLKAIQATKDKNLKTLNFVAILNFVREEIRYNPEDLDSLLELVNKVPITKEDVDLKCLKKDIDEELEKIRQIKNSTTAKYP
jgi:tetratricopeptide (TPR) repeat protein